METRTDRILSRIGGTPCVRLTRIARHLPGVEIFAKAEWYNPGGSVKDRAALAMVMDGVRRGLLGQGKTLIDATSGNTGISYALIGAAMGFPVRIALPKNASHERKRILEAFGVDLVLTDPLEGTDGAIRMARAIQAEAPERYFYPDQYSNPENPAVHVRTTGPEILAQSEGCVTHFVAGLGTSGTFVGVTRYLKATDPSIRCISFQPDGPMHGLEGLKHMPTAMRPAIYDDALADENIEVSTEESYEMIKRLAREEGLLVGVSSAAAAVATLRIAEREKRGVFVTVFADGAAKYLSERFWDVL
jgi:cysteine synthase B